jgi:hypothetical protein
MIIYNMKYVRIEAFTGNTCTKIFSNDQLRQMTRLTAQDFSVTYQMSQIFRQPNRFTFA